MALNGYVMVKQTEFEQLHKLKKVQSEQQQRQNAVGVQSPLGRGHAQQQQQQQQPGEYQILSGATGGREREGRGGEVQQLDKIKKIALAKSNEEHRNLMGPPFNSQSAVEEEKEKEAKEEEEEEEESSSSSDDSLHEEDLLSLAPYLIGASQKKKKAVLSAIQQILCEPESNLTRGCLYISTHPIGPLSLICHYIYTQGDTHVRNEPVLARFLKEKGVFKQKREAKMAKGDGGSKRKKKERKEGQTAAGRKSTTGANTASRRRRQETTASKEKKRQQKRQIKMYSSVQQNDFDPYVYNYLK